MLAALLITAVLATPMDLATGADLTAVRAIETASMTDEAAVDAWRAFLLAFPDSPLATLAWRRLEALHGAHTDWVPPDKAAAIARVARQARLEDEEAARSWVYASVAPLRADGGPLIETTSSWVSRFETGIGWDGNGFFSVGGGVGKGPAMGFVRIGKQRAWYAELAARMKGPLSFGPWAELHVDSLLRTGLSAGGEVLLVDGFALEARGGLLVDHGAILPRIGLTVAYRPKTAKTLR
ncbi:MAG: hypothetical protein KC912_19245 [Proteobacteria bacterium]|nr:hypothetical protein [Pseudomonadota bacterium]